LKFETVDFSFSLTEEKRTNFYNYSIRSQFSDKLCFLWLKSRRRKNIGEKIQKRKKKKKKSLTNVIHQSCLFGSLYRLHRSRYCEKDDHEQSLFPQ